MGRAFHNGRPASNLILLITLFLNEFLWQTFRLSFCQETNETSTSHGPLLGPQCAVVLVVGDVSVFIVIVAKLPPGTNQALHFPPSSSSHCALTAAFWCFDSLLQKREPMKNDMCASVCVTLCGCGCECVH